MVRVPNKLWTKVRKGPVLSKKKYTPERFGSMLAMDKHVHVNE